MVSLAYVPWGKMLGSCGFQAQLLWGKKSILGGCFEFQAHVLWRETAVCLVVAIALYFQHFLLTGYIGLWVPLTGFME